MIRYPTQYTIGSLAKARIKPPPVIEEIMPTKEPKQVSYMFKFLRAESVFDDIFPIIEANGLFQLTYIGGRGHGKTSSAEEFATISHKKGFLIIYGKAEDILPDLDGWVQRVRAKILEHGSPYVTFVLDDMSYSTGMISEKKAAGFKHFVADIRHVFEDIFGTIKLFIILISHRYHAVPPMLRSSVSWIFASLDNEDRTDAVKMLPKDKEEQLRLDRIYKFLQKVTIIGPKDRQIVLGSGSKQAVFKWGTDADFGDGRLMMIYHKGRLSVFNPRKSADMVDLQKCQFPYVPPEEKDVIIPNAKYRKILCGNCGHENTTKRPTDVLIQCSLCRKVIQSAKETPNDTK